MLRTPDNSPLLAMSRISKSFGAQRALIEVDFDLRAGEVHILAGENGAGKSTLIKILGGVHRPDAGEIRINGRPVRFRSPREASAAGIALIHQELSLAPSLSVADNVFLGRERSTAGFVDYRAQYAECRAILGRLGLTVDPRELVGDLPISMQQMIEIAKALSRDASILVMDEPTSALSDMETSRLFACVDDLRNQGRGIIYITHKLEEVYRVADRITVLRDGRWIASAPASDMPPPALIRNMVGREIDDSARETAALSAEPPILELADVSVSAARRSGRPLVEGVSLAVKPGEIVGLAGLQGSGNSDLLLALFGAPHRRLTGDVRVSGRPYSPTTPGQAIRRGLALVTNDRQRTGLVLNLSVAANATLASLERICPGGWMSRGRELALARTAERLRLRAASLDQPVAALSGGNQQKVVLAKWMNTDPRIILLDEPTRGVDIGAKHEIYDLMRAWCAEGRALILITSEMPELLRMCHRILVLHRGRSAALLDRTEATQERILAASMGGGGD
ncbi:MAG: sugar ABC transporter ATP-binding protein [Phycisphaerales bacterium]|nr:sugar ABC transporter ATP-binding protein [Phycisphaerales bacterium]